MGLTFRNSKWSCYARVNINYGGRTYCPSLPLPLLLTAALLLVLPSLIAYYATNQLINPASVLFWFIFDTSNHTKSVIGSSLLCVLQITFLSVQAKLLSRVLGTPKTLPRKVISPLFLPKRLHKPILHSWLTKSKTPLNLADFLGVPAPTEDPCDFLLLLKLLYSSVSLLKQSSYSQLQASRALGRLENTTRFPPLSHLGLALLQSDFASGGGICKLEYLVGLGSVCSSKGYFNQCSRWSLGNPQSEAVRYSHALESASGTFHLGDFSHSALSGNSSCFRELTSLRASVDDQLALIRWHRWLYKYNILHRSVLKNTRYLTSAKGLLSPGFYSSSLLNRNVWASKTFSKGSISDISGIRDVLYGDFSGLCVKNTSTLAPSRFFYNVSRSTSLGFYEFGYY
jgi:hypothetical protein